jgi:hypothetical protein
MAIPAGTIAPPTVKVATRGPAMSDAIAAPVPNRSKPLRKPTHAEATSKVQTALGGLLFGAVVGGALFYFEFKFLGGATFLFFCAGSLLILFGSKDEVSDCPFCGAALHNLPQPDASGVPKPVQCRKCWEYSGLQKGFVSPYDPNAVEERPTFRAPLAQNVVWPNGCVQCGADPTRFDEVGTFAVNKGLLVVGAVRVKTFKLGGVPYCDAHKKAVEMKTEIGNKLFLDWRSLPMMRRYMAANRGRFTEAGSH